MNKFAFIGAAALAFSFPAIAQDRVAVTSDGDVYVISEDQKPIYDSWPLERQTIFERWPNNLKIYYWTLTPEQQNAWWVLTDEQRARVYEMTPEQRAQAWTSIAAQVRGAASATATPVSGRGNMLFVSNPVIQNIPMDQAQGEVPICGPDMYDNCINAWEAGKRGPNVTRPLGYWPGPKNDPRAGE